MAELRVAFWNVENLFDPALGIDRGPQSAVELDAKISQLAAVCGQLFASGQPHVLGLIEVGDQTMFERLGQALGPGFVGIWSPPGRKTQTGLGILFDSSRISDFELVATDRPTIGSKPRAIVVECKTSEFPKLVIGLTHWKSRMQQGGVDDDGDRIESGRWLGELFGLTYGKTTPIILGGDFNAEPFERPFLETALKTKRHHRSVLHNQATAAYLYNPSWRWLSEPHLWDQARVSGFVPTIPSSTHGDGTPVIFDQIMVSRHLLRGAPILLQEAEVAIGANAAVRGPGDRIFPLKWSYDDATATSVGLSDHFPVVARFA